MPARAGTLDYSKWDDLEDEDEDEERIVEIPHGGEQPAADAGANSGSDDELRLESN